jgi:preprotein translocase subunit YajC
VLLLYVVLAGGVMVFMMSRSSKKQRAQQAMTQSALVIGSEVRTIGGLVGHTVEVTDEHVVIETTPGVRLKFVKSAIAGVTAPADPDEPAEDFEADPDADGESSEDTPQAVLAVADGGSAGDAEIEDAERDEAAAKAGTEVPATS